MNNPPTQPQVFGPIISRLGDFMSHITPLAFRGSPRLAKEAGIARRNATRLLYSECNPTFLTVARITSVIEKHLGTRIDPRDIFAEWGDFLTPHLCDLIPHHHPCLPDHSQLAPGVPNPAFEGVKAGAWVTSRYPKGYRAAKGGVCS